MTGKSARPFSSVNANAGLHLLPVTMIPALLESYLPLQFSQADYPAQVPSWMRFGKTED